MEMNKEDILLLIQAYESETLLWNPKDKFHFHKNKKMDAWQTIADSANISIDDAKKKMSCC